MTVYIQNEVSFKALNEATNWKLQELKQISVVRKMMGDVDPDHVINFKRWEEALYITSRHIQRFIESSNRSQKQFSPLLYDQVLELIKFCLQESTDFIQFCRQMKTASTSIQNHLAVQESLDHAIQQSDHFIGFAQTVYMLESSDFTIHDVGGNKSRFSKMEKRDGNSLASSSFYNRKQVIFPAE